MNNLSLSSEQSNFQPEHRDLINLLKNKLDKKYDFEDIKESVNLLKKIIQIKVTQLASEEIHHNQEQLNLENQNSIVKISTKLKTLLPSLNSCLLNDQQINDINDLNEMDKLKKLACQINKLLVFQLAKQSRTIINSGTDFIFKLSSGMFSQQYLQCAQIMRDPEHSLHITQIAIPCAIIFSNFMKNIKNLEQEAVFLGMPDSATPIASCLSQGFFNSVTAEIRKLNHLSKYKKINFIHANKIQTKTSNTEILQSSTSNSKMAISISRHTKSALKNKSVIIIEDVTTTGKSVCDTCQDIRFVHNGSVELIIAIFNRGGVEVVKNINKQSDSQEIYHSLASIQIKSYSEDKLPAELRNKKRLNPTKDM